jgi:hypothetical protein
MVLKWLSDAILITNNAIYSFLAWIYPEKNVKASKKRTFQWSVLLCRCARELARAYTVPEWGKQWSEKEIINCGEWKFKQKSGRKKFLSAFGFSFPFSRWFMRASEQTSKFTRWCVHVGSNNNSTFNQFCSSAAAAVANVSESWCKLNVRTHVNTHIDL